MIDSDSADVPFNPASVVKIATTLFALETLGPQHRYETRFGIAGTLDAESGVLDGDLVVVGGGDPDFHVENAFLVARALNERGVRRIRGDLLVDERFWIGWEGGSERRNDDATLRAQMMAERLRAALDPARWDPATRRAIEALHQRRNWDTPVLAGVTLEGRARSSVAGVSPTVVVVHRSNPLALTLKRLNAYSNNDIERLRLDLGDARDLAAFVVERLEPAPASVSFETLSGLGTNRLTARSVVQLLDELRRTSERLGLGVGDILPQAGCDPGTLKSFPAFTSGPDARALVGKTGTLNETDGGVAVLAGYLETAQGEITFAVASPRIGAATANARRVQQDWLLELSRANGGAALGECGAEVRFSDAEAVAGPND